MTRARIVLASTDGQGTSKVPRRVGVSRPTVIQWRDRTARDAEGREIHSTIRRLVLFSTGNPAGCSYAVIK